MDIKKLFIMLTALFSFVSAGNYNVTNVNADTGNSKREIISYKTAFKKYYDLIQEEAEGKEMISLDDFISQYYNLGYNDIHLYSTNVLEAVLWDNNCGDLSISSKSIKRASSKNDAHYILGYSYSIDNIPDSAFEVAPKYKEFDYSVIKEGDIIYETNTSKVWLGNTKHTGFVYDIQKNSTKYGKYILTIEAVPDNVSYGFLDDDRIINFAVLILRVNTSKSITPVKNFMLMQLGKKYNFDSIYDKKIRTSAYNTEGWYCSELIYAAYLTIDVNIGVYRYVGESEDRYCTEFILPGNIYASYKTYIVNISSPFLNLSISKKESNVWTIKVYNFLSYSTNFRYNTKMCNLDDGLEWKNLSDLTSLTIDGRTTVEIKVKENWFATSVVVSRVMRGYRYVTAIDKLDAANKNYLTHQRKLEI